MSFIYKFAGPMVRPFARGMLEQGMKDPEAFMDKVKVLQKKPLPLEKLHKDYDFEEKNADGMVYYLIHSQRRSGHRVILYFFGGGYCKPGNEGDFEYAADMADETGADVWVVWYALFPDASGMDIVESAANVYRAALREYDSSDIAFYGNSSGGALCFTTCVFLKKYMPELPLPGMIAAHSPSMRIPPSREEQDFMNALDKSDVIIPADYVNMYIRRPDIFKTGGFEEFASPIETDWHGFPRTLAIFGSDEVFLGYLPSIIKKCRDDNVELETYVGKGCHCFSKAGFLPESRFGRRRIYAFLRGERNPDDTFSAEIREELNRNQQGELNAVLMYRMLAARMDSEKDAAAMTRLSQDELRHAKIFRGLSKEKRRPDRSQGDLICLIYRMLGKERLFKLMAAGEYAAAEGYKTLIPLFPELESVRQDEKKHGDALMNMADI